MKRFRACLKSPNLLAADVSRLILSARFPERGADSRRLLRLLRPLLPLGWLVALVCAASQTFAKPLPTDPRILAGKLDNGVTWLYREHSNPPGKMALQIHVRTGSLNETDAQRGLAHFMEHMAFNGSEHFPPGKLIPYFESIGMQFGAHLNAYTSFDQTVYMLYTPNTDREQIDKALTVLSDYAFRASLLEEEINKERGVVLEESRTGKNAFQRIRDQLWPELYAGSRFAERLPIGKDDILTKAPRTEFADYYRAWYRPENITVLLVGDAKPEPILPLIKKWFGDSKADASARTPMGPEFKMFSQERALVVTDPEMAYCQLQLMNLLPGRPPTVTVEQARTDLLEYLGGWIIGRRFDDRVKKGEASFRSAAAWVSSFFNDAMQVTGSANGEPQDWAKMLTELITEIKRAREHGFTERELQLARKEILADAERAVRTEPTRNARAFLGEMVNAVNNRTPILSAQQNLELYQELLPSVALPEINGAFRTNFTPGRFAYVLTMAKKESVAVPPRAEVLAQATAAWAQKVEALAEDAGVTNLLEQLPAPGKIVASTLEPDLGITSAWLENGVRVHHRFMDYKKDSVLVSINLAGGSIEETAANAGITQVASLAVDEAATSRLSSSKIRDLMTGKNISVSGGGGGDSFTITVTGSPVDLEAGLQLAHALLTDGKIEEAAFKNWKLATLRQLEQRERFPQFKAFEATEHLLSGSDPRRVPMNKEQVEAQSIAKAQAWFDRLRREAPIEVAVVGDLKLETATPLIERYLGSLAKRPRSAEHLKPLRRSPRPPGPLAKHVKVDTVSPQAVVVTGFAAAEGRNWQDARALDLARLILTSRLVKKVREELSLVYSIAAQNVPAWIYEDAGRFGTSAPCDPGNTGKVFEEVHKLFRDFADQGPTDEELANAKKQINHSLDTEMREPGYWFGILRTHDLHGRDLGVEKRIRDIYGGYAAAQVQEAFTKYYTPARTYRVTAVPTGSKPDSTAPGAN
ncbi:MAG: insulinase family protein [Verrucomicrobia bacterium]|nr:insulinase family protein [Verrucomicrobiota bacterium]